LSVLGEHLNPRRNRVPKNEDEDSEVTLDDLPSSPEEFLTTDDKRELQSKLDSISRKRREAESEAQNLRIG
jgi:hypothetical protein